MLVGLVLLNTSDAHAVFVKPLLIKPYAFVHLHVAMPVHACSMA